MINQAKNVIRRFAVSRRIPCVFTLSTGRTGSTMLTRILEMSDRFISVHETRPYLWDLNKSVYDNDRYDDPSVLSRFLEGRWRLLRRANQERKTYADASNYLSFFAPALHDSFPNSKFIFLHRKPDDFVYSGLRRGWYKSHGFDQHRIKPKPGTEASKQWENWSRFQKICWLWAEYNSVCIDCLNRLDPNRHMELPSSDLWGKPRESLAALFEFLEEPIDDLAPYVELLSTPLNAQRDGDAKPPSEWSADHRQQLAELTGHVAEKLGYTLSPERCPASTQLSSAHMGKQLQRSARRQLKAPSTRSRRAIDHSSAGTD